MNKTFFYMLPILFLFFVSCDKNDVEPEVDPALITDITFLTTSSTQEAQEISVTLHKPTPCHTVKDVIKTISENTYNYDFILSGGENACITVIADETVKVTFDPSETGEYILNFSINGELFETRTVTVIE